MTEPIQLALIIGTGTLAGILLKAVIEARKTATAVIVEARKAAEAAKAAAEAAALATINARILAENHLRPKV